VQSVDGKGPVADGRRETVLNVLGDGRLGARSLRSAPIEAVGPAGAFPERAADAVERGGRAVADCAEYVAEPGRRLAAAREVPRAE